MNLADVIARIRAQANPKFGLVAGAADFARLNDLKVAPPQGSACYVVPVSEDAEANPFGAGLVRQRVAAEFDCAIALRDAGDAAGERGLGALGAARAALRLALLGWQPPGCIAPCTFVGGDALFVGNGVLWWADRWASEYTIGEGA